MNPKILCLDDADPVRQLLVAQIGSLGFTARTATTGLSALSLMRKEYNEASPYSASPDISPRGAR